jgi:sugar phosphate isomerase/epimerase
MISINTLSLTPGPFEDQVAEAVQLGAKAISPEVSGIEACGVSAASRAIETGRLSVGVLTHRAFGFATPAIAQSQRDRLMATIDIARALDARAICMTTGPRGDLSWPDAAARFALELTPCAEYARRLGVTLGLEPTSHLYADLSIVHRLADVSDVATQAGIATGIDLFACWTDADLEPTLRRVASGCAFVQISDYVLGDRGLPCRAVPGDGVIPLERLLSILTGAGFRGPFDLEIIGPRIEREGRARGLRRAVDHVARILGTAG